MPPENQNTDQSVDTNKMDQTGQTDAQADLNKALSEMDKMAKNPDYTPKKDEKKDDSNKDVNKDTKKEEPKKEEKKDKSKNPDDLDLDEITKNKGILSKGDETEESKQAAEEKAEQEKKEAEANERYKDNTPEEIPDGETERKEGWRAGKQKRMELVENLKGADKEVSDLKAKVDELTEKLNTSSLESPEYKKMEEEHKKMSETLEKVAFRESLTHQTKFAEPMKAQKELVSEYLGDAETDVTVEQLLSKSRKDMMVAASEIAKDMPSMQQNKFFAALDGFYDLKAQEADAIENAEEFNRNEIASNKYNSEKAFLEVTDMVSRENSKFLQDVEPDDLNDPEDVATIQALNEAKMQIPVVAKQLLDNELTEKEAVQLAYEASLNRFNTVAMKRIEFEVMRDKTTIKKLADHIKALREKNPDFNAGSEDNKKGGKDDSSGDPEKDFDKALSSLPLSM